MYGLAFFRNIPPVEYVFYGFDDPARRSESADYLYWTDSSLIRSLNTARHADNADVQDKGRFAELCQRFGLPHVPTLALFRSGTQVSGLAPEEIAETDLWLKPLALHGAVGSTGWIRRPDGQMQSAERVLDAAEWERHLHSFDCILQPRMRNHSDVAGMTNGASAVVRIVTVLGRDGRCDVIGAGLSLPHGSASNTSGALGYVLDLLAGEIHQTRSVEHQAPAVHPDTGTQLLAKRLPMWHEAVDLAQKAHRIGFSAFASLGWDVLLTEQGPVLLEANSGWALIGQQINFGPLGRTALSSIIAEELSLAE